MCEVKKEGCETFEGEHGERMLLEYSWDFGFPGDEFGYRWTVLFGKERVSGARVAVIVPAKGGGDQYMLDKVMACLEENGDKETAIVVKTDQENCIRYLVQGVIWARPEGRTIPKEAPKKRAVGDSSGSNGVVAQEVQAIE